MVVGIVFGRSVYAGLNYTSRTGCVNGKRFSEEEAKFVGKVNILFNELSAAGAFFLPPPYAGNTAYPRAVYKSALFMFFKLVPDHIGKFKISVLKTDGSDKTGFCYSF